MFNSFGNYLRLTTFGESHGPAIGGILDGVPAGLKINFDSIRKDLQRRKPGQSNFVTPRTEEDEPEFLSGIFEGQTTGAPIGFIIRNTNQKSSDYDSLKNIFRPSHADYTYHAKFGIRDHRGGGRSSAREMAVRVTAGAIAKQILARENIILQAYLRNIGHIHNTLMPWSIPIPHEENELRFPDHQTLPAVKEFLNKLMEEKDSVGAMIECQIHGLPAGLGEPLYAKFHAQLAFAILSINASKTFEIGAGYGAVSSRGSQMNDAFTTNENNEIRTMTNFSGGVQGGITNGMPVVFRVGFKPTSSIGKEQQTVDKEGNPQTIRIEGRHDPCVAIRAVPVVEAMAALVCADFLLIQRMRKL
ncbi:MAG: chorismate synthase [Bacteroidia bacterium]|nr:chorismate synthase [Bacteroidia bacterium]